MTTRAKSSNYKWYILLLTCLTAAAVPGAFRMCMPVLFKEIADNLHLSLVSVGTIWGMDALAGIFMGIPSGLLADRFGAKRTLIVACIVGGILGAMRGLSGSFFALAAFSFLFGLISASIPNVLIKLVGLWFRGKRLGMANGILMVVWSLGSMAATMSSATVLSPWLGGWRNVMFFWGVPCILMGVLWFTAGREPPQTGVPEISKATVPFREAFSQVIRNKTVWLMGLVTLFFFGSFMGMTGYLPTYLRNIGWSTAAADGTLTVLNGASILGVIPMVYLSDRFGSRKTILALALVSVTVTLAWLPFTRGAGVWVLLIVCSIVRSGGPSMVNVIVLETKGVGVSYGGTAMGLLGTVSMIGPFLAPPIGNSFARFGPGVPFLFWAGLSALAIVPFLMLKDLK
jgi:nitrate/nitrite transporter NarK